MDNLISPVKLVDADTSLQFLGSIPLPDLFRVQVSACHYTDTTYLVTATSSISECRGIIIGEFDYRTHDTLRTFRYRFSPDTILYNCLGSTVVNDNGIFITGVYNLIPSQFPYQQSPMWIVITKLDHQFNVVSHHFYGGDAAYYSYKTIETSDGGLLSVGRRWDNSAYPQLNTDPFALKVNSDGMVVSAGSPDDERISEAILFPNPTNDKVNIIMGNQVKHATVVFCNASGQTILQENLDQPVSTRDVSSYPPGMYFYKIFSGKKMIGSGKWIKQ